MPSTIHRAVLAAALLLLASPASAEETVTHELARKHYDIGKSYYEIANYTQALEEFKKAYALQPLAGLIFNMGRCYEGLGDRKQAITHYRLYLSKLPPDSPNRAVVELRVKNLEQRVAAETPTPSKPETTPATGGQVTPPVTGETPQPVSGPVRWKRIVGWTALGVGVASLAAGIGLGAMVRSKNTEYRDGVEGSPKTYFELNEIASSARSYQKGEIALLVVGGVVAAGGIGLVIWDAVGKREAPAKAARIVPYFANGGGGVVGSVQF
jgi:tetratricopeptide (TPR) repeat protein